ncbi:uncharacterized protein LOC121385735 [Gigantopelta aegis]|uniref:uncharacterized protein LOC121385735 n=1 Tax=Gigantopelta aegis TaxID=1735272 RepID=UPI001B88B3B2|nr:uncharacterized protein LOC121385735 [Gigantopelta aegis]
MLSVSVSRLLAGVCGPPTDFTREMKMLSKNEIVEKQEFENKEKNLHIVTDCDPKEMIKYFTEPSSHLATIASEINSASRQKTTFKESICKPEPVSSETICKPDPVCTKTSCKPDPVCTKTSCKPDLASNEMSFKVAEDSAEVQCKPVLDSTETTCKPEADATGSISKPNAVLSEIRHNSDSESVHPKPPADSTDKGYETETDSTKETCKSEIMRNKLAGRQPTAFMTNLKQKDFSHAEQEVLEDKVKNKSEVVSYGVKWQMVRETDWHNICRIADLKLSEEHKLKTIREPNGDGELTEILMKKLERQLLQCHLSRGGGEKRTGQVNDEPDGWLSGPDDPSLLQPQETSFNTATSRQSPYIQPPDTSFSTATSRQSTAAHHQSFRQQPTEVQQLWSHHAFGNNYNISSSVNEAALELNTARLNQQVSSVFSNTSLHGVQGFPPYATNGHAGYQNTGYQNGGYVYQQLGGSGPSLYQNPSSSMNATFPPDSFTPVPSGQSPASSSMMWDDLATDCEPVPQTVQPSQLPHYPGMNTDANIGCRVDEESYPVMQMSPGSGPSDNQMTRRLSIESIKRQLEENPCEEMYGSLKDVWQREQDGGAGQVQNGSWLNSPQDHDEDGDTVLHDIAGCDPQQFRELFTAICQDANFRQAIDTRNKLQQTPLFCCVTSGNHLAAESYLHFADPNIQGGEIDSDTKQLIMQGPLHKAVEKGDLSMVLILLSSQRLNIDAERVYDRKTPLMVALQKHVRGCQERDRRDIIQLLVNMLTDQQIDLAKVTPCSDRSVLMYAVESKDIEIVKYILDTVGPIEARQLINTQNKDGNTSMHIAAGLKNIGPADHVELGRLLLRHGGQQIKNYEKPNGMTPKDWNAPLFEQIRRTFNR